MTASPGESPEAELILSCAHNGMSAGRAARARRALGRGIDWERLLRTAELQGVAPLVHANLNRVCPGEVPAPYASRLRRLCRGIAELNLALAGELLRLLELFERRGIAVIPFKGPVLGAAVYGSLTRRTSSDLDLLVREHEVGAAQAVLGELGYRMEYHEPDLEYHFVHDGGRVTVDLHQKLWSAYYPPPEEFDALHARLRPVTLGGGTVGGMAPEDTAYFLPVHLAKDCRVWRERLCEICDVSELVAAEPELNWEGVLSRARDAGGERIVLLALWLAHDLLEARVPEAASRRLQQDPQVARLGAVVRERLLRQLDGSLEYRRYRDQVFVEDSRFYVRLRERRRDKLRYLRDLAKNRVALLVNPSDRDRAFLPLPRGLGALYYLIRPLRVARDRVRSAASRSRWTSTLPAPRGEPSDEPR